MKVFITGAAGNLGAELVRQLAKRHRVVGADILDGVDFRLDVTDYQACRRLLADIAPDIVVHPAAWTDVDGCAKDPARALLINGVGTAHLAALTAGLGIPLLYVSSNEVFDGKLDRPYVEYDRPNPVNAYGYSKCYGERALAQTNPKHYIVRSSWLFAHGGRNFIQAISGCGRGRQATARRHQRSGESNLY